MKTVVGSSLVSRVAAWLNPYSRSVMTNGEIRTSRTKPEVVQIRCSRRLHRTCHSEGHRVRRHEGTRTVHRSGGVRPELGAVV